MAMGVWKFTQFPGFSLALLVAVAVTDVPCVASKTLEDQAATETDSAATADGSKLTRLFVVVTLLASVSAVMCCVWLRDRITCPTRLQSSTCLRPCFSDLLAPLKRLKCPSCSERVSLSKCPKPTWCPASSKCKIPDCLPRPRRPEFLKGLKCPTCPCLRSRQQLDPKLRVVLSELSNRRSTVDSSGYEVVSISPEPMDDGKFSIEIVTHPSEYQHLGAVNGKSVSPVSPVAPTRAYDHVMLTRTPSAPTTDSEYMACASKLPSTTSKATAYDVTVINATTSRPRVIGEVYDKLNKVTPLVMEEQENYENTGVGNVVESETQVTK